MSINLERVMDKTEQWAEKDFKEMLMWNMY